MIACPGVLSIIGHDHRRDVGPTKFSGELEPTQRGDDLSSVNQLVGRIEQLKPVEEEGALLWIEKRESLVEQHLSHVGFDLGEIRIDGPIEGEILPDSPSYVSSEVGLLLIVPAVAERRRPIRMRGCCRCRFENEPAFHVVQSIECSRLREKVCIGTNGRRPGVLKSRVLHSTENVQPPTLHSRILIAKTLEGYPHFDFIPTLDKTSLRLEEVVRVEIHTSFERIDIPKSAASG